jgi:hypothetical protein
MSGGSDLSLDEMSIQIRSRYAGDLMMFNKDNNCGKFHVRFFAVCCAFTWACLRLRTCTRKKDDVADHPGDKGYGAVPQLEKINDILVDMLSPYSLTNVVLNMDNFYCSPTVAKMLAEHAIWVRGTVVNKQHFPKVVIWGKGKTKRGDYHIAANKKDGVVAGSCYDGVAVNFITTADTSDGVTTVTRKIDFVQQEVKSHTAIKRYNRFMQAVDRNDQLRVAFSLATRHAFKKYYIKYFLSLFDIYMTNEMVHYFCETTMKKRSVTTRRIFLPRLPMNCVIPRILISKFFMAEKAWPAKKKPWMMRLPLSYLLPKRNMMTFLHRLNATTTVLSDARTGMSGNTTLK